MASSTRLSGASLLLPISEAALRAVLPIRERIAGVTIPFPPNTVFEAVSDKALVVTHARKVGVPTPTIAVADSASSLTDLAEDPKTPFPLALKPTRSVVGGPSGRLKTSVLYARNAQELAAVAWRYASAEFPVLVQRRIVGPGVGVFLLIHGGEVIARLAHRRLREKPPSGGVSVLRETIRVPESLFESSTALLRSFGWEGVAMVEYKVDRDSGEHHLMEINGRLWGSLQLAIDAGVDFPTLLARCTLGERVVPSLDYRVGVRTRWMLGDLDHLLARLTRSRESLGLPPDAPGRFSAAMSYVRGFLPPIHDEVFRLRDPAPAFREGAVWLRDSFRALRR
jgi:predicted ATP-grasp superfamily ATP-dependent carboligase